MAATSKQRKAIAAANLQPDLVKLLTLALDQKTQERVHMPAHGFVVGDWVYYASGAWAKADRDAVATFADGMVSQVPGTDEFIVASSGRVGGLSGLTADATYYLSSTPGAMQDTAPSGNVQVLGKAISANWFRVAIQSQVQETATYQSDIRLNEDVQLIFDADGSADSVIVYDSAGSTLDFDVDGVEFMNAATTLLTAVVKLLCSGELEIDGDLNHDGSNVGFYGVAPVARPSAYTQNYSTADRTHAVLGSNDLNVTATSGGWGYASEAEANSVETEVNAIRAELIDLKQLVNSIIDDLQSLGLFQ